MAEQTINPVLPVTRSQDVLQKKKPGEEKKRSSKQNKPELQKKNKKGIIDTYA